MRSTFLMAMALAATPLIAAQTVEDPDPILEQSDSLWQLVAARLQDLASDVQTLRATTSSLELQTGALASDVQTLGATTSELASDVQSLGDTTNELVNSHPKYDYFFSNSELFELPKWDGQTSKWDRAYWGDLEYEVQPGDVIETSLVVKTPPKSHCETAVTDFLFGGEGEEPTPLASSHAGAYHPSKWLVFENKYEHPIDAAPMTYRIGLFNWDSQSFPCSPTIWATKYQVTFKVYSNASGLVHTDFKPTINFSLDQLEYYGI